MSKQITITLDDQTYQELERAAGSDGVGELIEAQLRLRMSEAELEIGYRAMALDEAREREALEWAEALIQDVADDPR